MLYVGIILVLLVIYLISVYNKLAKSKVVVEEASSDIETFLKQRYDMIPNLVEIVKGYAKHESGTFKEVTELRTKAMAAGSLPEKMKLEEGISGAISKIFAVAENYPELKANTNFADLSEELRNTENKISFSRQFYNDSVTRYNTKLELFPLNLVAGMFNFQKKELFAAESDEARKNVKVDFSK